MQKFVTNLWFDDKAEEAANFYVSLFKNSKVIKISHYTESSAEVSGKEAGSVLTVDFELDGQRFTALNGGPEFKFSEAISILINCENQEEIDRLWEALTADGGEESVCGWLKDKYGLSWQVVPESLDDMMTDSDPEKSERVMKAMLEMRKLDISKLQEAYEG